MVPRIDFQYRYSFNSFNMKRKTKKKQMKKKLLEKDVLQTPTQETSFNLLFTKSKVEFFFSVCRVWDQGVKIKGV